MKSTNALLLFIVCAVIALSAHFLIFEMRYMWYLDIQDHKLLRGGYIACACAILALWAFFPSRVLVALLGVLALFFPHLYYATGARPLLGREIDLATIWFALLSVATLVGATELRRRIKAS